MTGVKGQQDCGSCYAFAGVAVHETALLKAGADLSNMDLSEQFIIDCGLSLKMNYGCGGGLPHKASATMVKLGGYSPSESEWPYIKTRVQCPPKQLINGTCHWKAPYEAACEEVMSNSNTWHSPGVQMIDYGYCYGKSCSPELLKHVIWTYGSAAVTVWANGKWGNYDRGVLEGYAW